MPWPGLRNLTHHDLAAIYEYLSAVPCVAGLRPSPRHNDCFEVAAVTISSPEAKMTLMKWIAVLAFLCWVPVAQSVTNSTLDTTFTQRRHHCGRVSDSRSEKLGLYRHVDFPKGFS